MPMLTLCQESRSDTLHPDTLHPLFVAMQLACRSTFGKIRFRVKRDGLAYGYPSSSEGCERRSQPFRPYCKNLFAPLPVHHKVVQVPDGQGAPLSAL